MGIVFPNLLEVFYYCHRMFAANNSCIDLKLKNPKSYPFTYLGHDCVLNILPTYVWSRPFTQRPLFLRFPNKPWYGAYLSAAQKLNYLAGSRRANLSVY